MSDLPRLFICLDCEGPITQNDNAFEMAEAFIPHGGGFFARVSRYDDFLADVLKRPGYKAGDTLRLILPFFKAFGLTNQEIRRFSRKTLRLLPGACEFLAWAKERYPTFIISTSYRPYLDALCEACSFPPENVFCTEVDLDSQGLSEEERRILEELAQEIAAMPLLDWPEGAKGPDDLEPEMRQVFERLDEIFFSLLPRLSVGRLIKEVNPVGGQEKARATEEAAQRVGLPLSSAIYVGDSITDAPALEEVRRAGGLSVSFNGNRYALRAAEVAVVAYDVRVIALMVEIYRQRGRQALRELRRDSALLSLLPPEIQSGLDKPFEIYEVREEDLPRLIEISENARKAVRGVAIGALG